MSVFVTVVGNRSPGETVMNVRCAAVTFFRDVTDRLTRGFPKALSGYSVALSPVLQIKLFGFNVE